MDTEFAPHLRSLLEQGDPVTAGRKPSCRGQAADPGADDEHPTHRRVCTRATQGWCAAAKRDWAPATRAL
jgi:hypothetical protein